MQKYFLAFLFVILFSQSYAQAPKSYSAADILQQMKKLETFGSVLYIAAHPDDENTRLLGYLANEKCYRTGYLSLTRGDGGQNLIGNEQGIDLGLVRTQELLAARRTDGAEQFFSTAYDFGFSKNPEEALRIWGHDKILSDVVWVIRKFRPDVIITRFPTTGEGGHGHHTASAILAGEAFDAAADPKKFPEQLKYVQVWQAKRLLWNTFNFGGNNTTREDQLKIDCGGFNPIIGKGYGEIAAESRSQHKSQGFGVPAQRGVSLEYFSTIKGDKPSDGLMDGVSTGWERVAFTAGSSEVKTLMSHFDMQHPEASLPALVKLYDDVKRLPSSALADLKLKQLKNIIEACSGLFMEAFTNTQLFAAGDTMRINVTANNRSGIDVQTAAVQYDGVAATLMPLAKNMNASSLLSYFVPAATPATQPYWLQNIMNKGSYEVSDQSQVGLAENMPLSVKFTVKIEGENFVFAKPVRYKYTDPVKGEIYEPVQIINPVFINNTTPLLIFSNDKKQSQAIDYSIQPNLDVNEKLSFTNNNGTKPTLIFDTLMNLNKADKSFVHISLSSDAFENNSTTLISGSVAAASFAGRQIYSLNKISYDHIPDVFYNYIPQVKVLKMDLKIAGSRAGYIAGAGDKIPEALRLMGYTVTVLTEKDISTENLKQFDVIVTGVRAYNIHDWLNNSYNTLMQYVEGGGVLLVQYNTNNSIGPVKAKISPYPFNISRSRITDETAAVDFLLADDAALNYPNKITNKDFDSWIQERSTYHADNIDPHYRKIFSMHDPGEAPQDGSLLITDYGKGKFVYTGIVFFRELPAGVPGAYRLFANLIAKRAN